MKIVSSHARQRPFFHGTVVTPSGRFAVTPALLHNPTGSRVAMQNASTNESSVDDVVDLAVTRLPASTFSAREAMMPIRCHYCATATLVGMYYTVSQLN